ncbi:ComEC/Rec2 family competence protein [Chitinophaga tropicalis]|nr:ComEC/Rec2 family competence protein [Chitinophaga tropicalis]
MFVNFIKRAPFIRITTPLIAGIIFQLYIPLPAEVWLTAIAVQWLLSALTGWLPLHLQFSMAWVRGCMLQLILSGAGALLVHFSDVRNDSGYFLHVAKADDLLLVTVKEPLQRKKKTFKTRAEVIAVIRGDSVIPAKGLLLLYLEADSAAVTIQDGNRLLLRNRLQPVSYSGNPGAFNYRQYCALQQVHRQAFVHRDEWIFADRQTGGLIASCRNYCLQILQQYIGGKEAGLAAALLIGYRYELDAGMMQDYMQTGIVHIIAISGMHMALIYGSLVWLLGWWPRNRFTDVVKGILILLVLWGFTFLTGGGASVWRATVMFTFLATGEFFLQRYSNPYNTLAASAFMLLCYEPRLLLDAGFQLSYLAVLSIMICYRPLYCLWEIKNRWLNKLWGATALTLAAQVFTLPVCLYYFHQFPVYFLPANLLAVPLSTIILYGEMLLLLYSPWQAGAYWTGQALQQIIGWMNTCIAWIGHWPGALITDIDTSLFVTVCAYVCLAGITGFCLYRWRTGLLMASFAVFLWSAAVLSDRLNKQRQQKMVVWQVPGHTAVSVIYGRKALLLADSGLVEDGGIVRKYLQPSLSYYGVDSYNLLTGSFLQAGNIRLVVVDSALPKRRSAEKFKTDYLLLSHNPHVDIRQLESLFDVGCYIFDASCSSGRIRKWKSDCYALTLRFFSVPDQGAYVVNF